MRYHRSRILLAMMAAMSDFESVDPTSAEARRGGHLLYRFVKN
jgi:hypothetical protein